MPKTQKGIYHNLKESKYTISNSEVVFFFSSKVYLQKYLDRYLKNRQELSIRMERALGSVPLNLNVLADISLYETIEKRGFRAWVKGVEVDSADLYRYSLRKMDTEETQEWFQVINPKTLERMETFIYE
jgi:phosphotransacetylase